LSCDISHTHSAPFGSIAFTKDEVIATIHPDGHSIELRNSITEITNRIASPIAVRCVSNSGDDILVVGFGSFCVLKLDGSYTEPVVCHGIHTQGLLANEYSEIWIATYNSGKVIQYKRTDNTIILFKEFDINAAIIKAAIRSC
jgi:hypothetical protein